MIAFYQIVSRRRDLERYIRQAGFARRTNEGSGKFNTGKHYARDNFFLSTVQSNFFNTWSLNLWNTFVTLDFSFDTIAYFDPKISSGFFTILRLTAVPVCLSTQEQRSSVRCTQTFPNFVHKKFNGDIPNRDSGISSFFQRCCFIVTNGDIWKCPVESLEVSVRFQIYKFSKYDDFIPRKFINCNSGSKRNHHLKNFKILLLLD